jgi:hypothetical protein
MAQPDAGIQRGIPATLDLGARLENARERDRCSAPNVMSSCAALRLRVPACAGTWC